MIRGSPGSRHRKWMKLIVNETQGVVRQLHKRVRNPSSARSGTMPNEIELLLGGVAHHRTETAGFHGEFAIPRHAFELIHVRVANAK